LPAFLLALLAAAGVTFAGSEAVRVARLSAGLGRGAGVLAAGWMACVLACVLAAQLGAWLGERLEFQGEAMLAAAFLVAGVALAVRRPGPAPAEPTRSFGAIAMVLGGAQLFAAASPIVLALAARSGAPWPAAAGGALGSGAVLAAAWASGAAWEARLPLPLLRYSAAGVLVIVGLMTGLAARGIVG